MVAPTTYFYRHIARILGNTTDVGVQFVAPFVGKHGIARFYGKDDMQVDVYVGVGHWMFLFGCGCDVGLSHEDFIAVDDIEAGGEGGGGVDGHALQVVDAGRRVAVGLGQAD